MANREKMAQIAKSLHARLPEDRAMTTWYAMSQGEQINWLAGALALICAVEEELAPNGVR